MDQNKLKVLKEIGYKVRRICGSCTHFSRKDRKPFGVCRHNKYSHLKHTDARRTLTAYEAGHCSDHEWKPKVVAVMHTFEQLREGCDFCRDETLVNVCPECEREE